MTRFWKLIFIILVLTSVVVWIAVFSTPKGVKIITCNVGQGDATLIVYKNMDILIDGGPDNKVLGCLSKYMPFWDRVIEIVILTHPQKDHYTGLIGVFERYQVKNFLANSLNDSSQMYSLLKKQVLDEGAQVVNPVMGMTIGSEMIQLDILHPSREYLSSNTEAHGGENVLKYTTSPDTTGVLGITDTKKDPNEFSIIALLTFGSFKLLFTGDAGSNTLDTVATTVSTVSDEPLNYIKISHHGSKGAISEKLYDLAAGAIAAISVGNNSYGHPNKETLDKLKEHNFKILRTDEMGDIVIQTDGKKIWVSKN